MKIKKKTLLNPKTFNFLYSVGASIVILGALFKILHWEGADLMLIVGMGTEAFIFFVSAFDDAQVEDTASEAQKSVTDAPMASAEVLQAQPVVQPSPVPVVPQPVSIEPIQFQQPVSAEQIEAVAKEMETLDRNIKSFNTLCELQIRTISPQLGNISKESDQLAENLRQLNETYARMLQAMKGKE